jgi:UDP-glucose 4-epimerase
MKGKMEALEASLEKPARGPARPGDLKRSCLNVDKAREKLGWQALVGLTEGIEKTLSWRLGTEAGK